MRATQARRRRTRVVVRALPILALIAGIATATYVIRDGREPAAPLCAPPSACVAALDGGETLVSTTTSGRPDATLEPAADGSVSLVGLDGRQRWRVVDRLGGGAAAHRSRRRRHRRRHRLRSQPHPPALAGARVRRRDGRRDVAARGRRAHGRDLLAVRLAARHLLDRVQLPDPAVELGHRLHRRVHARAPRARGRGRPVLRHSWTRLQPRSPRALAARAHSVQRRRSRTRRRTRSTAPTTRPTRSRARARTPAAPATRRTRTSRTPCSPDGGLFVLTSSRAVVYRPDLTPTSDRFWWPGGSTDNGGRNYGLVEAYTVGSAPTSTSSAAARRSTAGRRWRREPTPRAATPTAASPATSSASSSTGPRSPSTAASTTATSAPTAASTRRVEFPARPHARARRPRHELDRLQPPALGHLVGPGLHRSVEHAADRAARLVRVGHGRARRTARRAARQPGRRRQPRSLPGSSTSCAGTARRFASIQHVPARCPCCSPIRSTPTRHTSEAAFYGAFVGPGGCAHTCSSSTPRAAADT